MPQRDRSARRVHSSSKTNAEDLPVIVGGALSRALSYGEAKSVAAAFGCSEGHLSRLRSGERRLMADELPALVQAMAPSTRLAFFSVVAEACGFRAAPAVTAAEDWQRQSLALHAAIGALDSATAEALEDGRIDRQEAGELMDALDVHIERAQRLRELYRDVRDEARGPIKLHGA